MFVVLYQYLTRDKDKGTHRDEGINRDTDRDTDADTVAGIITVMKSALSF
jgi:hypothetical protein